MTVGGHIGVHRRKDMTERSCYECKSKDTYMIRKMYQAWNKHPTIEGVFICGSCKRRLKSKMLY